MPCRALTIVMLGGFMLGSGGSLGPALAAPDTPVEFVRALGGEAISVLGDSRISEETRTIEFRRLLGEGFDLQTIGRFALGRYWRRASVQERREYATLFEEFVVIAYASRLGQYAGETLHVDGARTHGDHDTIVSSEIRSSSGRAVRVDWRVRDRDGDYKVIDVVVEGLSMAITQRDEFSSVIQREGGEVSGLIAPPQPVSSAKRSTRTTTRAPAAAIRRASVERRGR